MNCPIQPTGTFVVLLPEPVPEKTGRILLAESAQRSTNRGTVVACGPECETELAIGDYVTYNRWLSEVEVDGQKWLLVREDDVLAKFV